MGTLNLLIELFVTFFKIGLFSFGGGYAMMPFITQETSVARAWMTATEVTDVLAVSQIAPGAFAVNAATFSGMKVAGFAGACVATLGVITPSVIICILISRFFIGLLQKKSVQGVLYGVRPVVVGLIASVLFTTALPALYSVGEQWYHIVSVDWLMVILAAASLFALVKLKFNPILVVGITAAVGLLLHVVGW